MVAQAGSLRGGPGSVPGTAGESRGPVAALLVDPDRARTSRLSRFLDPLCALVDAAETPDQAEALCRRCQFDLFVVALTQPCDATLEWLQALRDRGERADVILTAEYADVEIAISALRSGVADLLVRPFRDEQLMESVQRCLRRRRQMRASFLDRTRGPGDAAAEGLIGESPAMREVIGIIERVAPASSTLLLQGKTGTGKELIARAIHRRSGRTGRFVAVNCGAIPSELLDSELFGHVRGAFTGASTTREGLFVCAENGTLFLDEIAELPLPMQANLLRVLEERRVRPVGGNQEQAVNCRVIAASNVQLEDRVQQGSFREDLHFRLNVLPIQVPSLRERAEDIPLLITHFMRQLAPELGMQTIPVPKRELERLQGHDWPGNVRELRNLVERALLLGKPLLECCEWARDGDGTEGGDVPARYPETWSLSEVSRQHVLNVLERVGGNKSEAARRLHISRKTLERKIHAWNRETPGRPSDE